MAFCENCGARVPDDAKFCESCGSPIVPMAPSNSGYEEIVQPERPVQKERPVQQERPRAAERQPVSGNSGGGFPKAALLAIVAVILVIAAIVVVLVVKGKKGGKGGDDGNTQIETTRAGKTEKEDETTSGKEDSSGSGKDSKVAKVKVPKGAEIVKDAQFVDLIGEYEGEIQLTVLDGFEQIDGVPANFGETKKKVLSEPIGCDFEIDDDGQWELNIDLMAGMDFDTHDYDDPNEFTPAEINDMMISMIQGGQFHAKIAKVGEDKGQKLTMNLDNIGAYCEDGDKKLIAGNFCMNSLLYGADVTIQGDYVVHKTSEEFYTPETAPLETVDLERETEEETEETTSETEAPTEDVQQGMREIGTVSGGTWTKMGSGAWVYEKNGRIVKDSWIDDNGVFYYVDEDGYMLTDGITPDGYYVGPDGSYNPNAQQNAGGGQSSGGSGSSLGGSSSDLAAVAARLSTDKIAYATEFDWFLDIILGDGKGSGIVVTDPSRVSAIKDPAGLNGGWKAYMYSDDGSERYFNADVSADGDKLNITTNWKYFWIPSSGQSVEESGSDLFKGTFDKGKGTATVQSTYAQIDIEHFYVASDQNAEYAYGTFYWISGEIDHFALMRFKE